MDVSRTQPAPLLLCRTGIRLTEKWENAQALGLLQFTLLGFFTFFLAL